MIGAGTYAETINRSQVPSGTSFAAATTIQAAAGQTVVITGTGGLGPVAFQSPGAGITKQYIIIKGTGTNNLILDPGNASTVPAVTFGGGGNGGTLQFIRIDGVTIRNVTNASTMFIGGGGSTEDAHHIELINSLIHDWISTGVPPQNHGIYIASGNNLVENNQFYNGEGYGIHLFNSGGANIIHDNRITRNIVHDVCRDPGGCAGIVVGYGASNQVSNNLIYNIGSDGNGVGIDVSSNSSLTLIHANTIYNTDYWGMSTSGTTSATITNNILSTVNTANGNTAFSNNGSHTYDNNLCSTAGTNCEIVESSATTFVTPGSNFTIKAGSAALNAGGTTPTGLPYNVDLLNVSRPQGVAYDLGALELVTAGAPVPTVTITGPTASATYNTAGVATVTVSGTSSISGGAVAWSCDRCTPATGTASGTSSWSTSTLTMKAGINVLTVTHTTAAGGVGSDIITITYPPTFPGNALVAAYSFDAGSGTSAADASGNANTGTLVNTPTWVNGRFGQALQFNGTTQYVTVPDANSLDLTQSFSISLYVMPTVAHTDFRGLVIKNSLPLNNPYALYASITGECGDGGIAGYSNVNGVSGPTSVACSATPLQINVWTHLALTWNGTTMTLYKNGVSVATNTQAGYMEPSAATLQIGATEYGEYFQGLIDEVRIYNFALPLTGGANTVFGNNCTRADETNIATASVIGDANCPITAPVPPLAFKISADAAGLKIGNGQTFKLGAVSGGQ